MNYSTLEQSTSGTSRHRNALISLAQRVAFNFKMWWRNRRELRNLDKDQLYDVGLSREAVEQACRLNLLRR